MENSTADKDIRRYISESAELYIAPDGKELPIISLKTVASIANSQGMSAKEVEIAALN